MARHIASLVVASLVIVALYLISLRYDVSLAWFAVGTFGTLSVWVLYLLKEKGKFPRHAYFVVLVAVVYGMWYLNGLKFGFSLAWFTLAVFGWPLMIWLLYLGREKAHLVLDTPRGALLFSSSIAGGMLVFLYATFGLFALIVFLMPLYAWSDARRKALE